MMTRTKRKLSASLEDYLETIYHIVSEKGGVRSKDIAERLEVKAGSVTGALQTLAKKGYVNYEPYDVITLTSRGFQQAKLIIRKHEILKDFFVDVLGCEDEVSEKAACGMEHSIPDSLVERLISFTEFVQSCPRCGDDLVERFQKYCSRKIPDNSNECRSCIRECMDSIGGDRETSSGESRWVSLLDVPKGERCIVRKIRKKGSATKRLVEMGISRGSVIEVERVAPLGDPMEVKVKGYHLSIRKDEAKNIEVEKG